MTISGTHRFDSRWQPLWGWGLTLAVTTLAFAVTRALQVRLLGWGSGYDIHAYARYAGDWASGGVPYVTFHPEYPPGALLVFALPALFRVDGDYGRAFHLVMLAFDFSCLLLVVAATRLSRPPSGPTMPGARPVVWAAAYLCATAALFPVLYTRFDLAPAALTLAAVVLLASRRGFVPSGFFLGAGAAVKLWPVVLVPLWLIESYRRRGRRGALVCVAAIAVGLAAAALPASWRAGSATLSFAKYHAARSIQAESGWASMALIADAAGFAEAEVRHEYGAFHVKGPLAATLARISTPTLILLVLLPQVAYAMRSRRRRQASAGSQDPENLADPLDLTGPAGPADLAELATTATAATAGFIIGGKVLSPQYVIWLVPLLPLALRRLVPVLVGAGAVVLTSVVYPYLTPAIEGRAAGHLLGVAAATGRNLSLLLLYLLLLAENVRSPVRGGPSSRAPLRNGPHL